MKKFAVAFCTIAMVCSFSIITFADQWKEENGEWKYMKEDGSFVEEGWQQINDYWYYFDNGYILKDTITPDGYTVDSTGAWDGKEIKLEIAEKGYSFTEAGQWVEDGLIPSGDYVYYPFNMGNKIIVTGSKSHASQYNFNYIRLYDVDTVNPGTYIPINEAEKGNIDLTKPGVFLVGTDIGIGTYNIIRGERKKDRVDIALCLVFNTIPSSKDGDSPQGNIAEEIYVQENKISTVEVKEGQYLQLINCTADLRRP